MLFIAGTHPKDPYARAKFGSWVEDKRWSRPVMGGLCGSDWSFCDEVQDSSMAKQFDVVVEKDSEEFLVLNVPALSGRPTSIYPDAAALVPTVSACKLLRVWNLFMRT
jgi:hypothetical protein